MYTKRIEWVDIAKGFSILLVIIGHGVDGILRGVIFSFHMPLFFILSCVTFKFSTNADDFIRKSEKSFKHLFLPAVFIYFLRTILKTINDFSSLINYSPDDMKQYVANIINVFVVGSGAKTTIGDTTIGALGVPWFLIVLFFGRTLFDYLQLKLKSKWLYITIIVCSITGICIGKLQWLPFSFDIALAIQPFFLIGYLIKKYDIKKSCIIKMFVFFATWITLLLLMYFVSKTYLELACRRYPLFPLCFISAIAGTMFISCFSQLFSKIKYLAKPIMYLGKNSMVMLWVHCFDSYFKFAWELTTNNYINITLRVAVDVLLFSLIMIVIKTIKKHNIKRNPVNEN